MRFLDRTQAGEKLAQELRPLDLAAPFVLAIPRGGIPVGRAVAAALACPFDVISLIKIPVPWMPEASYGAIAPDGVMALNLPLLNHLEISLREMELAARSLAPRVEERNGLYRGGRPLPSLAQRTVVLVDDGLGSGYSMLAALQFARKQGPRSVLIAAPICAEAAFGLLAKERGVERIVALFRDTNPVFSLASFYKDFSPVSDEDVAAAVRDNARE